MRLDSKTESFLGNCYPRFVYRVKNTFKDVYAKYGLEMKVTEGVRSFRKQNELYMIGRENIAGQNVPRRTIVTNALPGLSYHQYGLAIDACFQGKDPFLEKLDIYVSKLIWEDYGRFAENNGLIWGGKFKFRDMPHIELNTSFTVKELKLILEHQSIQGVWSAIDVLMGESGKEWMGENASFKPLDPRA